ncbi:Lsd1/2 complex PHD finger protein Phf2 [Schizosaccharomyces pombe]|uniref:SWM histone demethylase complex subunit phf2 n=1 Tax=Schizosaccharomyces pombe (strain 972 / ATCC 24843) TaxID=284812 RepID=PHF2_SCHPO|nr:Lsd1/2 complex PHD finger domain-containing protein Phf2 [Schizosaccharomyces pombe]Q09908.1 RecName: Full=SWM histone demethylase complex subunit phf2; AltName: Full=PHD finger domain-containing protein phf2 [Schizosaccharomyces pombe 972h-]CAA91894.1 Lsd1/2 complex PHD finger containing protein Phf2 [Schizosaccharomyces pombe]|eukprot:NP_593209.1 Lsd1/2 complex PHD finger domain-containing protein Phf2 [Schizosaccharomyces pombe]
MPNSSYYDDDGGSFEAASYPFQFDGSRRFPNDLHPTMFEGEESNQNGGSVLIDQAFQDIQNPNVNSNMHLENQFQHFHEPNKESGAFGSYKNDDVAKEIESSKNQETDAKSEQAPFTEDASSSNYAHHRSADSQTKSALPPNVPASSSPLPPMSIAMNIARKRSWPASLAIERDNTADALFSTEDGREEQFNLEGVKTKSGRKVHRPNHFDPLVKLPTRRRGPGRRPVVALAMKCSVCQRLQSPPKNRIVFCDGCNTPFHQLCHEPYISDELLDSPNGEWFCDDCIRRKKQAPLVTGTTARELNLSSEEKKSYLLSLPISQLVDILLFCEQLHPDIPFYSPKTSTIVQELQSKRSAFTATMNEPVTGDQYLSLNNGTESQSKTTKHSTSLPSTEPVEVDKQYMESEKIPTIDEYLQEYSNEDEIVLQVLESFPAAVSFSTITNTIQAKYSNRKIKNSNITRSLNRLVRKNRVLRDARGSSYELNRTFDADRPSVRPDISITGPIPIDWMLYTPHTEDLTENFCTYYMFDETPIVLSSI